MKRLMILFGMLATLAFIGCNDQITRKGGNVTESEVKIALSCKEFQEKSILPTGQSLSISSYVVTGSGPKTESFSLTFDENATHTFNLGHLTIGSWHIEATAKNAEGTSLAQGEADVVFTPSTKETTLTLDTLTGEGNLSLSISWPTDQVDAESYELKATLLDQNGTSVAITPDVEEGSATITKEGLASGSYVLCLELLTQDAHVSGATTAVRIVDNATSSGEIALAIGDRTNEYSLVIKNETSLPIQATVTSDPSEISAETSKITLTATPTNLADLGLQESDLSYQWYHEGCAIEDATGKVLEITEKKLGSHRYDVVITSSKPGSIGSVTVTVNTPTS